MSIYDCITYFDEDLILNLRFNILDKYVDKFIIVESNLDHSGKPKKLNFKIENFPSFKNKIYYYVVEDMPEKVSFYKKNWSPNFIRENFQRNAIKRCLDKCDKNDLIIISDADEIPNLNVLNYVKIKKFALFKQISFMYKLNLVDEWNWLGSGISYLKYLKSPQWLRNKRFLRRGFFRRIFFKTQLIENGGWHFTFLKSPKDIFNKMKSYAHSEFSNVSIKEISDSIIKCEKFFSIDKEKKLIKLKIDDRYPDYIRNNLDKYKNWIVD